MTERRSSSISSRKLLSDSFKVSRGKFIYADTLDFKPDRTGKIKKLHVEPNWTGLDRKRDRIQHKVGRPVPTRVIVICYKSTSSPLCFQMPITTASGNSLVPRRYRSLSATCRMIFRAIFLLLQISVWRAEFELSNVNYMQSINTLIFKSCSKVTLRLFESYSLVSPMPHF